MKLIFRFLYILFLEFVNNPVLVDCVHCKDSGQCNNADPGEPLYLTPLINAGQFEKAQEVAAVHEFAPIKSYSGFITVNEENESNIFFWYFPSEKSYNIADSNIPVILWSDGGPGAACIATVFDMNIGPYNGKGEGTDYDENPLSWHKKYHMIFIDNPVEVGFSHTKNENGYIHSGGEAAKDIYEFLQQFFRMFPHLQNNPFYNAGVSYGATYVSETASYIHQQNLNSSSQFINLKGVILDSPWIEAYSQALYGDVLFGAGLISEESRTSFLEQEEDIRTLIDNKNWTAAFNLWWDLAKVQAPNLTGYEAMYYLNDDGSRFSTIVDMTKFVTLNSTRKSLHIGNTKFEYFSQAQFNRMSEHMVQSSASKLDDVLQNGYKFLLYVGNMDVLTGYLGVRKLLESTSWEGRNQLVNGTRTIWKVDDKVAGYITSSGNATMIIIRNAGHGCTIEQPEWVLNAISSFLD